MPWIRSCLCHQEKKRPSISPPIHLLLKPDGAGNQNHAFRAKVFKKPRPCHLCHQPILHQGSCCRVCKYVCHKVCESKDTARYTDTSWQIYKGWREISPTLTDNNNASPSSSPASPNGPKKRVQIQEAPRDDDKPKQNGGTVTKAQVHNGGGGVVVCNGGGAGPDDEGVHTHETPTVKNGARTKQMSGSVLTSQPRASQHHPQRSSTPGRGGGGGGVAAGGMDLSYVTERIIALWFPADVASSTYRQGQRQAAHMLHNKHADNYMVFNLSEPRRAARSEHERVREVGWPPGLAPPLERLCSVCKDIDSWLSADKHRIAVLHARGSRERLGVVVAAYMHYSSICGTADQALDRFAMRRFLDDTVGPMELPSNKRYVEYFSGLLSGTIRINAAPLYLTHVTVLGAPAFDAPGGCRAFLKVYEGLVPVYTSGVYTVNSGMRQFTVNVASERQRRGLQLRGDILVKCYHHRGQATSGGMRAPGREVVFACQFHTCAVADHTLSFTRLDLDAACNDLRFPLDGAVELHFSRTPETRFPTPAPTPAVPVDLSQDAITRYDSYEHLGAAAETTEDESDADGTDGEVNHTYGPLDGSIYATIAKKPDLSPVAGVTSPLTVSMDSGISSSGHQQAAAAPLSNNTSNASSSSPPPAGSNATAPITPEDRHRELDELLSDMLMTVESIPDLKPATLTRSISQPPLRNTNHVTSPTSPPPQQSNGGSSGGGTNRQQNGHACEDTLQSVIHTLDSVSYIDDDTSPVTVDDRNIPYHARQDSRPFTYGSVPVDPAMIKTQSGLASPSLVRKASFGKTTYSNGDTVVRRKDPIDDLFTSESLRRDEYARGLYSAREPLKRSNTEGALRRNGGAVTFTTKTTVSSPYSDSESLSPPAAFNGRSHRTDIFDTSYSSNTTNSNLTWLQRQQQKLKERREMVLREERQPHETRLISELRTIQHTPHRHMRPTASHRLDGYTSDTTAFADDDDDFTIPLHINTTGKLPSSPASPLLPHRTSSKKYSTISTSSSIRQNNERPFVAVKRAHEQNRKLNDQTTITTNSSALAVGHSARSKPQNMDAGGLLSVVEQEQAKRRLQQQDGGPPVGIDHHHDALADLIASLANASSSTDRQSDSSSDTTNSPAWHQQYREESISSWRTTSVSEVDGSPPPTSTSPRPQTPAFPVHPRTPYSNNSVQFDTTQGGLPPKSPTTQRRMSYPSTSSFKHAKKSSGESPSKDLSTTLTNGNNIEYNYQHTTLRNTQSNDVYQHSPKSPTFNGSSSPTVYYGHSRRSSVHSNSEPPQEVPAAHVKFVRDTSKYWYKPTITREEAISLLRNQTPGTFVVRDSNSFPGAFGLALKVATPPPNVQTKSNNGDELVRHFLIEPTSKGVRLKGCSNEPVFSSLSALVYQHSVMPLALPCRLLLPEGDSSGTIDQVSTLTTAQQLLTQGAACNVLYLFTCDMESLTGPQAIRKAVLQLFMQRPLPKATIVHFKVSGQGITLTDNKRKLFFRRHYPANTISYCGLDPDDHRWSHSSDESGIPISSNRCFGFVARKPTSHADNQCHVFAELEPEQPATAIVNFVSKVMMTSCHGKANIV